MASKEDKDPKDVLKDGKFSDLDKVLQGAEIDTESIEQLEKKKGTTEDEDSNIVDDNDMDDIIEDILQDEDLYTELEEEENLTENKKEESEQKETKEDYEGINLSDFVTAQMAIQMYQEFWVGILSLASIMFFKKDINKDAIRVGQEIEEISAELLDVYWSTIKIKMNPVVAAGLLIAGTNIYNFSQAVSKEFEEQEKEPRKRRRKGATEKTTEDIEETEYEDVTEKSLTSIINNIITKYGDSPDLKERIRKANELFNAVNENNAK